MAGELWKAVNWNIFKQADDTAQLWEVGVKQSNSTEPELQSDSRFELPRAGPGVSSVHYKEEVGSKINV